MQRWFLVRCAAILSGVVVSVSSADDAKSINQNDRVLQLITRLSDSDPVVSLDAQRQLAGMGETARPAMRKAAVAADLQTRCQLDEILLHIPWVEASDSSDVGKAFTGYAEMDPEMRCEQVDSWPGQLGSAAAGPLLRVVLSDPSAAVRWEAANVLRLIAEEGDSTGKKLIEYADGKVLAPHAYLPAEQNAALLAAAAWALRQSEPDRASALFTRAIDLESVHPAAFRGQMDFALQWLGDRAVLSKNYPLMISLLRQEAARAPWEDGAVPDSVARLFAAHADYGPFPGLVDDLRCYSDYLVQPPMVYAVGRVLDQRHLHYAAVVLDGVALLMGGTSTDSHYRTGVFLAQRGWDDAAQRELLCSFALSDGKLYYALYELAALAEQRDDDLAAAQYLERWLKVIHDTGQVGQSDYMDQKAAEAQWRYLRAYHQTHDKAAMQLHLEKFMEMDQQLQLLQKDPGMAADIVPVLQELGREADADRIFDSAYQALLEKVKTTPADPMPKNNLAWLCACSGKKLDDAVKYADQAVAQDPEDSACLDTQAESYFRSGHVQQAVAMESKALQFKPNDVYMQRQLVRFKSAGK